MNVFNFKPRVDDSNNLDHVKITCIEILCSSFFSNGLERTEYNNIKRYTSTMLYIFLLGIFIASLSNKTPC